MPFSETKIKHAIEQGLCRTAALDNPRVVRITCEDVYFYGLSANTFARCGASIIADDRDQLVELIIKRWAPGGPTDVDMGIEPFAIATSVNLIIAQRLARRLCSHCSAVDEDIPKEGLLAEGFSEEEVESGLTVYKAVGCDQCNDGYKGRVGLYQVMPISDETKRLIMEGRNAMDLADQARREGIRDIRQSALIKVKNGITSIEEINRVTLE